MSVRVAACLAAAVVVDGLIVRDAQVANISEDHKPHEWRSDVERAAFFNFIDHLPCTRSGMCTESGKGFPGRFDWACGRPPDMNGSMVEKNPRSVFATTHLGNLATLVDTLERLHGSDEKRAGRVGYFTGDLMISKVDPRLGVGTVSRLLKAFPGGIWWQAYDVPVPGITVAPDGINGKYMAPAWDVAKEVIDAAALDRKAKPKQVLAAWGTIHPQLDELIPARKKLHEWMGTAPALAAGVEFHSMSPKEYWRELAKYRFLLSPRGGGILSPKNDEALLVLTIPISTREGPFRGGPKTEVAFDGLVKLGWPMVVLDAWDDITTAKLDEWWQTLSPRLISFRRNCLTSDGFWFIVTGQVQHCA